MRALCLAAALLALLVPRTAPARAPRYRVHDLTPTFWRYWDEAHALPAPEQLRLFQERVVAAHPHVYTPRVLSLDADRPLGEALAAHWPRFLGFVGPHLPLARELSARVGQDLPRYDSRFRKAFPDFAYAGDVYFLVSRGVFDGATRPVEGKTALLFGTDVMAAVYGRDADPESFFHHELFHLYHDQFPDPALGGTLARSLWVEGLAVYVAEQLNPGTPEPVLFGLPRGMPDAVRERLPELAARLRARLDSREKADTQQWFSGQSLEGEVPGRAGYYLGYLMAKELGKTRTPGALARLRGTPLRRELERALRRLEKTPAK